MKKTILSLVIVFAVLLSACSYRYVEGDVNHERKLIVPFGKDYTYTPMSWHCVDLDSWGSDVYETVSKLYRLEPVYYEEYACTKPGLPEEILVYQSRGFTGWYECPIIFVQDGYDMPTFSSTDKIESICYVEEYSLAEEKEYIEITGDVDAFIDELYSCRTAHEIANSRDIDVDVLHTTGCLYYKFKDIDGLLFKLWIFATDDPDMYFTDYTVDETYYSIVFPKELLERYFPIAS